MRSAVVQAEEEAGISLKQAAKQREMVSKIIDKLSDKATELDNRVNSIQANAENVRDQLDQSFSALDERLTKLADEVPQAAAEQKILREVSGVKLDEFKENSEYEIHFAVYGNTEIPKLPNLMEHFRNIGFKVTGTPNP